MRLDVPLDTSLGAGILDFCSFFVMPVSGRSISAYQPMMIERGARSMRALYRNECQPDSLHHSEPCCESVIRGAASGDHTNSFLFVSAHPQSCPTYLETCFSYQ